MAPDPPHLVELRAKVSRRLHARLKDTAEERMVSVNYLVVRALEELLEHLPPL